MAIDLSNHVFALFTPAKIIKNVAVGKAVRIMGDCGVRVFPYHLPIMVNLINT